MDEKEITDALQPFKKKYVVGLQHDPLLSNLISPLKPEAYSNYEIYDEIANAHARHLSKKRNNFTNEDTDMIMERYNLRMKDKLRRHVQELLNRTRVYEKAAKNELPKTG